MVKPKKLYLVIACTHCKRLLLASSGSRTRTCPYCERRVKMGDAHVIASSKDAREARLVLQEAKTQEDTLPE